MYQFVYHTCTDDNNTDTHSVISTNVLAKVVDLTFLCCFSYFVSVVCFNNIIVN